MSYQKAYTISLSGDIPYPYEQYQAVIDPDYFTIAPRPFLVNNLLRYQKRPSNEVISSLNLRILDPKVTNAILKYDPTTANTYISANPVFNNNSIVIYIEDVSTIELNNTTTNFFNSSALRTEFKTPQIFQLFYIQNDPNVNDCYGYLLYPNKLFLNPTKLTGNSTLGWTLSTKTNVIAWSAIFIGSTVFSNEAYDIHNDYITRVPPLCSLNDLPTPYTLNYSVCGMRSRMDRPILPQNFSSGYQPTTLVTRFENDTVVLKPDSTFMTFDASFVDPLGINQRIIQQQAYSYTDQNATTFGASFILNSNSSVNSIQKYQLLQTQKFPISQNIPLADESNSILKCNVDLSTSIVTYTKDPITVGTNGTNIKFDYIAEALNINGTPAINTFSSIALDDGTPITINGNFSTTTIGNQNIIWKSSYPPHYYSYKTRLQSPIDNSYLDSFDLNFYLTTSALNTEAVDGQSYTLSLLLTSVVASDYNALVYDLYNNTKPNEKIKYTITNSSIDLTTAYSRLSAQYGPQGITYPLASSPWIDADKGSYLKISYPPQFGEIQFSVRASLQGDFGIHDALDETSAVLGRSGSDNNNGTLLTLNVLTEQSNSIVVDASYNVNEIAWPSRDLRGSKVRWFVNPFDSFVKLYSVNTQTGRFIQFLNNGEEIDFDETTQTIGVSGYGPEQTIISLSSQKYDETASISTNPTLFDYFSEGVFVVSPKTPLNNLNRIRTIELKVQVPFQEKLYDVPQFLNIPIYWTWEYNDIIDPLLQPISAFQPLNNARYEYGTSTNYALVSAIKMQVYPPTDTKPTLYTVKVQANSDIKYPPVTGSYIFTVDAFPDKSIFNSDFKTYYKNYPDTVIADTYFEKNTITRSADDDLSFTLVNDANLLSITPYEKKSWVLNSTTTILSSRFQLASSDRIDVDSNVLGLSSYKITLTLDSATAQGWVSAHNVSADQFFYAVDPTEFYAPLEFILYPEYAWIGNSSTLTFLTTANYTLSYRPSAYGNKKNNSQAFWLSANKSFYDSYIYTNTNNSFSKTLTSSYGLIDFTYDPEDITVFIGIPISLQCYDSVRYPISMGTQYYAPSAGSLGLFTFSNYAITKEYNDTALSGFDLAPTIEPYNDLHLNYTIDTEIINLDISRDVTITQTISTIPDNTPAIATGGTVTYFLSSQFWTVSSTIPAVDGTYNIFKLNYGDPAIPLFSGQNGIDRYYLYVRTNVIQQIPPTTFPSGTTDYAGNTNLWEEIIL